MNLEPCHLDDFVPGLVLYCKNVRVIQSFVYCFGCKGKGERRLNEFLAPKTEDLFEKRTGDLRTFARKSSNIYFFIKLLLQLGYEFLLSEMQKN